MQVKQQHSSLNRDENSKKVPEYHKFRQNSKYMDRKGKQLKRYKKGNNLFDFVVSFGCIRQNNKNRVEIGCDRQMRIRIENSERKNVLCKLKHHISLISGDATRVFIFTL